MRDRIWLSLAHMGGREQDFIREAWPVMERIVREVDGVNRVVYDITAKPPGTIEWE